MRMKDFMVLILRAPAMSLSFIAVSVWAQGMPQMPPPAVTVEKVELIRESPVGDYVGIVTAIEEVEIKARIAGFINKVHFTEGATVEEGDLLFEIEDATYNAHVARAEAVLEQVEAELKFAESQYQRQKVLSAKDAVSLSVFEESQRHVSFSRAKLQLVEAELVIVKTQQGYTRISSPISGRIGKMKMTRGNYVDINSPPLARVVQMDPVRIKFSLSERIFQELYELYTQHHESLEVKIILASGKVYPEKGVIEFVDNVVDTNTGTISVWMRVPNKDEMLIPGGYVNAVLSQKEEKPLAGVRLSSILTDNKGSFVYTVGEDGKAERRDVKLGSVVGNFYTVLSGVAEGEMMIIEGIHKVAPGLAVNTGAAPPTMPPATQSEGTEQK